MARVTIYKNSILASAVSIGGYGMLAMGLMMAFNGEIVTGIVLSALGLCLSVWASFISENKRFKVWKKKLEEGGFVPGIQSSVKTAIQCYNACPGDKALAYIRSLNPAAADNIAQQLAAKKNK